MRENSKLFAVLLALALAPACGGNNKANQDADNDTTVPDGSEVVGDVAADGEDVSPDGEDDVVDEDAGGYCGDGITQTELGEVCDDGGTESGDGCSADCLSDETCGNGITDVDEDCDGEDWCTDDCRDSRLDADSDTITDLDEDVDSSVDTDGDGTADWEDTDSDGDTIPDADEAGDTDLSTPPVDTDGDTIPDFRDLDSDADTIPDEVEGSTDTDGDGVPDFLDTDSDGDGLPDIDEAGDTYISTPPRDTDGDGVPDYLDLDSDNDGIPDLTETLVDTDGDGLGNAIDPDSDGDGISDLTEGVADIDGDGTANFLDLDSDGDGLLDEDEVYCSTLGVHSFTSVDTDGDGDEDLVEALAGSDLCDASSDVLGETGSDFFFELPPSGTPTTDVLLFYPQVEHTDTFFSMDTTGSMGGEIANLRSSLGTIMTEVSSRVADAAFGVGQWEDYPVCTYGASTDLPWELIQTPTTDRTTAQTAVDSLTLGSGMDMPESGYESLFQLADGAGTSWTAGSGCSRTWAAGSVPAYTGSGLGGAGFRVGSLPIVMHITDAVSHIQVNYTPYVTDPHSRDQAITALNALGIRVITIQSGSDSTATTQLNDIADSTGASVPVCAFKTGATTWRCGADQCCTGIGGTGISPMSGMCTLRYQIAGDGSGLGTAAVDGVDALVRYATFEVYTEIRDDGSTSTPDTSCFIKRAEALAFTSPPVEPEASCTPAATPAEFFTAGFNNGFSGVATGTNDVSTTGTELSFTLTAENDTCATATSTGQIFTTFIDIIDVATSQVLDTQSAVIFVPPSP
ncbi:MAG: hypothetical protein JRG91_01690 [Deltaproteobacteria bacterium]|nr:hypothetical protein [Deltaproteobacteria bacterium]